MYKFIKVKHMYKFIKVKHMYLKGDALR